jgi:hypothetical protein
MTYFMKFKTAVLLALIGIGLAGSLSACIVDDGFRGGHERGFR